MPTLKQSRTIDRSQLEPVQQQEQLPVMAPPMVSGPQPSPFMRSSLPPRAAGMDQFTRQFYNRSNLPQRRIFIPNVL